MKLILVNMILAMLGAQAVAGYTVSPLIGSTNMSIKGSDISGSTAGAQLGVLANMTAENPDLQYETGLLYTQAGAKNDALIASTEYQLEYLAIPVGVQYRLSGEERSYWYARGGLTLAALMSAKSKSTFLGISSETDIKDQVNSFDILPYIGIGSMWAIGESHRLGLDLNYTRGLMKVFKDTSSNSEGLAINLTYGFPF